MSKNIEKEFWLSGKVKGVPDLLQPTAHAILQTSRELYSFTENFPKNLLWEKVAGRASVGFHLQHITGVIDRMLSYAKQEKLTELQFSYLRKEGIKNDELSVEILLDQFSEKKDEFIQFLQQTNVSTLIESRTVGRENLPSTLIGLLFHAAEHSQRHTGQLLVTISFLKNDSKNPE